MHKWDDVTIDHVSFSAPFPHADAAEEVAPGRDLLLHIGTLLVKAGYDFQHTDSLYYAHEFRIASNDGAIDGMLGLANDEGREWLLFLNTKKGWLRRLTGSTNVVFSEKVAQAIHGVLSSESKFSDIRWYTARGWNEDPDTSWKPSPAT